MGIDDDDLRINDNYLSTSLTLNTILYIIACIICYIIKCIVIYKNTSCHVEIIKLQITYIQLVVYCVLMLTIHVYVQKIHTHVIDNKH